MLKVLPFEQRCKYLLLFAQNMLKLEICFPSTLVWTQDVQHVEVVLPESSLHAVHLNGEMYQERSYILILLSWNREC
jgi:hypothetical protein